jgi:diguanylate cyclase (GGDEF)-like protein
MVSPHAASSKGRHAAGGDGPLTSPLRHGARRGFSLAERLRRLEGLISLLDTLTAERSGQGPLMGLEPLCSALATHLEALRCTILTQEHDGSLRCRAGAAVNPPGLHRADLPSLSALAERLNKARARRNRTSFFFHDRQAPSVDGTTRSLTILAIGVGDHGLLALEGDASWRCSPEEVALVRVAASLLEERSRDARRVQEDEQHMATARALRQLLEMGVQAGSPIEAAKALASTAARVLGFPIGCAYLVDEEGRITEVVSVGTDEAAAERLRANLVGQLAALSPVWQRTLLGPNAGPDLIADTTRKGVVREGGVARLLGLRSMAAIPLLSSEGPLGLVLCGDHEPRTRWRAGDRELLAQLSLEGAVVVDNARLRQAERHEASHDALTGLLNRRAFSSKLAAALLDSSMTGEPVGVCLLDLDRFKEVNDHLGHHRGDELLVAVGERIRACLREGDELARLGGDEFAVLLTKNGTPARAQAVAAELGLALEDPFEISDSLLQVDASIGVACFPNHASDPDALLQRADAAMYEAKRSGADYALYGPAIAARTAAEIGLRGELRRALAENDELTLYYQPKIDLATGAVEGVEALVRWRHPRRGMVPPGRFVPMAEESGLIRALTSFVVPRALAQAAQWREAGLDVKLAVNISARDLADRLFAERVHRWLGEAGLPGDQLLVEVTEGAVMGERHETSVVLEHLRDLGVQVSLDDFGTGYSSLAYLSTLPVDEIKIDREFLQLRGSRQAVIRSIVALGHDLEMRVVAEGVETLEQARWLAAVGCDQAQGYHFSPPLPPDELAAYLSGEHPARRARAGGATGSAGLVRARLERTQAHLGARRRARGI